MLAISDKTMAICGRYNVYVSSLTTNNPQPSLYPLEVLRNLPSTCKIPTEKLCVVCCDISPDGKYITVADSGKNVFVYEFNDPAWELFACWDMDKRVVKLQFDNNSNFVILTDKAGEVHVAYLSLKSIKTPKKILGHASYILDVVLTNKNDKIITCDRDEKIRISNFPSAFDVDSYFLGHKEAVVNIVLIAYDYYLVSVSVDGIIKLWHFSERKFLKSWNAFIILLGEKAHRPRDCHVTRMKSSECFGKIFLSLQIQGFKELPIFEINPTDKTLKAFGQLKLESEYSEIAWEKETIYLFAPEVPSMKRYILSESGIIADDTFSHPRLRDARSDFRGYAMFNKASLPLRKRVPTEVMDTVTNAREILISQFGPVVDDDEPSYAKLTRFNPSSDQASSYRRNLRKRSIRDGPRDTSSAQVGTSDSDDDYCPVAPLLMASDGVQTAGPSDQEPNSIDMHLPPPDKGILKQKSKFDMSSPSFVLHAASTSSSKKVLISENEEYKEPVAAPEDGSSSIPLTRTMESTNFGLSSEESSETVEVKLSANDEEKKTED